jgi:uncharacterized protein (DUF1501 family)
MKRRNFLKVGTTSAIGLPVMLNGLNIGVLPQNRFFKLLNPENDKVLVLIQLSGGNDGLNMVIPLDQYDNLANVRQNIVIPRDKVLKLSDKTGLHPAMTGMKSLWDAGKMNLVHSVGYPNQNRSHFRSTDIWTSASEANEFLRTGWLGRYFDTKYGGYPDGYPNTAVPDPIAITMGSLVSETCQGVASNFSLALNDPFSLNPLAQGQGGQVPNTPYGEELEFLRTSISQTNAYTDVITGAAKHGNSMATYPANNRLATQLKNVAYLISGGLQTKVYICSLGGFDTHSAQVQAGGDTTIGNHATLLQTLSDAVSAFQEDLRLLGLQERVIGMTFSEFGRQIQSNASLGTDHGTAAPLFLFGTCLQPGFTGENPEILRQLQPQEGVAMQVDFRNIYGSVFQDWFEVEASDIRELLFDDYQHLNVVKPCAATFVKNPLDQPGDIALTVSPNPFSEELNIQFISKNERVRVSMFGTLGQEIEVLIDKKLTAGNQHLTLNTSQYRPGNYYVSVQMEGRSKTKVAVKH